MQETGNTKRIAIELFILSFVSLFFELLVIRWLSADIRAFTVLKCFPLASCYIGLGLGFVLKSDKLYRYLPLSFLVTCVVTRLVGDSGFSRLPFPTSRVYESVQYNWQNLFADQNEFVYLLSFMIGVALLLASPFVSCMSMGSRLGQLFNKMRPIHAYSINLGGALLGTIGFAVFSFLNINPGALFIVPAIGLVFFLPKFEKKGMIYAFSCLAALILVGVWPHNQGDIQTYWSPYQRIDFVPIKLEKPKSAEGEKDEIIGYRLLANKVGQQVLYHITPEVLNDPRLSHEQREEMRIIADFHELAFLFKKNPQSVLNLATGLGNDVAVALRHGAKSIEAVELDPITIELGRKYNIEKPYDSPGVKVYCDDARHYIEKTDKKYDVVRYAFLDSMTVLSSSSTSRLDNYIYTKDSFERALQLVKPDGMLFVSFYAREPWFVNRLFWTITEAAGYKPLCFAYDTHEGQNVVFVLSEAVKNGTATYPENMPSAMPGPLHKYETRPKPSHVLTDDWPFLFWTTSGFDIGYFAVTLEVLLIALVVGRKILFTNRAGRCWQLFFLGAAFLLLELQSIARFALLYGTTWITTSVVISGVLIMLLGANVIITYRSKWVYSKIDYLYFVLFASLIASFFLPTNMVLGMALPEWLSYGAVTLITLIPMFLAGLIFGSSIDQSKNASVALGFNLLGGVLGALLEYFTSYIGINAMVLISLALYVISMICLKVLPAEEDS